MIMMTTMLITREGLLATLQRGRGQGSAKTARQGCSAPSSSGSGEWRWSRGGEDEDGANILASKNTSSPAFIPFQRALLPSYIF